MDNKILYSATVVIALLALLSANATMAVTSTAAGNTSLSVGARNRQVNVANASNTIDRIQKAGDTQINNRITALNNLIKRISEMKNVSDAVKSAISGQTETSITSLAALKAKIDADISASTTMADRKTITADYRVYALVIPQGYIVSAADRINTIAQTMANLSAKLAAKITEAQTAGNDIAAMQASLTEMNAKIADAKAQAKIALDAVSSLTPDQGDQTKAQANHAVLVAARANIKTATQDINAARKDAQSIVKTLREFGIKTSASANTPNASATTTAH